jgi:hypothetical protein
MSETRLLEIAERLDILNDRMGVLLNAWVTPESEAEMQAIEKEYDLLFDEAEILGVSA